MPNLPAILLLSLAALTQPAPEPPLPAPTPPTNPVLQTTSQRTWTLSLRFRAFSENLNRGTDFMPGASPRKHTTLREDSRFSLGRAAIVAPLIERTSTHEPSTASASASLRFDGRPIDDTPEFLADYQAGERLARFDAQSITNADDMELWLDIPMLCRSVSFDEPRAAQIPWPAEAWPAICASALQPQLAIDPNNEDIFAFTERTLGPKPYADTPVIIAKKLAAAVITRFQPNGIGIEYDRTGRFAGIELNIESETATKLTGSPADMAALYCAALRAAGVPARPVIGYNLYSAPEARDESLENLSEHCGVRFEEGDSTSLPRFSFWVEFALYNEADNTLEWIPVDVFAQRRASSRPPALDQPWLFFGSHPCAEALLPISHHFFPPTTVVGMGAPLLWGWIAEPEIPRLTQTLQIWASATPVTTPDN